MKKMNYFSVSIVIAFVVTALLAITTSFLRPEIPSVMTSSATARAFTRVCTSVLTEEYDQTRTLRYPDGSRIVYTFSHSIPSGSYGELGNYRSAVEIYDSDGMVILERGESIVKDGYLYGRGSVSREEPETLGPWELWQDNLGPLFPKGCVGDVRASGVEGTNEDANLRHLVWEEEASFLGERDKWELWVDPDGRPVRGLVTVYEVAEQSTDASGASGNSGSSPTPIALYTIEETYSGFGEPNVITAPITPPGSTPKATATPTPSPAPTPSDTATPVPIATSKPVPLTAAPTHTPTPVPDTETETPDTETSDIVSRYDANGDGVIDDSERRQAGSDYTDGKITYAELLEVLRAYLSSG